MFNLPTLVSLTAPTCAGKNYLLEKLVANGFDRIVSTTNRRPRTGEIEGVHYFFISTGKSLQMEAEGEFAELITYNGTRYGVTHKEMELKMAGDKPPIVILEPQGVQVYRQYCGSKGWTMFMVYVDTLESIRLERLAQRTADDAIEAIWPLGLTTRAEANSLVLKTVQTNNKRLKAILEEERLWSHTNRWDVYASGTDSTKALAQIEQGVKNRNARSDIYR